MEFYVTYERFKDILEVFQSTQNRWVMFFTPRNWKRYIFHRGLSWNIQSTLGEGLILGGKEEDKARHAVFLTPTNPSGDDSEEERLHDDFTVKKNALHVTKWKYDKNAVYWVRLSKAQDQGLEFWQTKSFAIMTYATIPGDCIDRVTSQNGERVIFKRLETPRPVPKVKRVGKASSSSIPLLAQTYLAS